MLGGALPDAAPGDALRVAVVAGGVESPFVGAAVGAAADGDGGAGMALAARFMSRTACSEYGSLTAFGDDMIFPLGDGVTEATGGDDGGGATAVAAGSPIGGGARSGAVTTPLDV
ncbi:MAG TPA: hypothetical protein VGL67_10285, partial [Casimicrobiaceae bacterium]